MRGCAHIARYAWGDDYHEVMTARLEALVTWMRGASPEPFEARAYVDTGPVQERVYAQHAGIGWIGKNTCVINPQLGSWTFLGEIICSLPLDVDVPASDQCGTCTLCLEACPTQALVAPGVLDATRCVSYLTIELRDPMAESLRAGVGTHVYGCDVCQEVCPWNAMAPASGDPVWQARPVWDRADVETLAEMSDQELAEALQGSAMRRSGVTGLRKNLAVALGKFRSEAGGWRLEARGSREAGGWRLEAGGWRLELAESATAVPGALRVFHPQLQFSPNHMGSRSASILLIVVG